MYLLQNVCTMRAVYGNQIAQTVSTFTVNKEVLIVHRRDFNTGRVICLSEPRFGWTTQIHAVV